MLDVIIVAAGNSTRFSAKKSKTLVKIGHKPLLWYSINSFQSLSQVNHIYLVVSQKNFVAAEKLYKKYYQKAGKIKDLIIGGHTRQQSVYNALLHLEDKKIDFVAVHDAARPFVKPELINQIFQAAVQYGAAAPGIAPVDTIKQQDDNQFIDKHLPRAKLVAIQTPQIFKYDALFDAYKKAENELIQFTDDTEIYSHYCQNVKLVSGDKDLIKITYKEDLKRARTIYKRIKKIWS